MGHRTSILIFSSLLFLSQSLLIPLINWLTLAHVTRLVKNNVIYIQKSNNVMYQLCQIKSKDPLNIDYKKNHNNIMLYSYLNQIKTRNKINKKINNISII